VQQVSAIDSRSAALPRPKLRGSRSRTRQHLAPNTDAKQTSGPEYLVALPGQLFVAKNSIVEHLGTAVNYAAVDAKSFLDFVEMLGVQCEVTFDSVLSLLEQWAAKQEGHHAPLSSLSRLLNASLYYWTLFVFYSSMSVM
jgi:hypothetical protein